MKVDMNSLSPSPFSLPFSRHYGLRPSLLNPSAIGTNDLQTIRARYSISYDRYFWMSSSIGLEEVMGFLEQSFPDVEIAIKLGKQY
ncbi:hypothetical protein RchiOBHm_Chr1g0358351 [Rosa chinensis]|uniref:Uncharacterized protein n=1 Tax=Rosa chinensis TaxID=74649 RepID=A0A2P6SI37_ROSCH|nr:hypothetical protein RchiOBHm_Chr1g0358351 [Rosa chinensis]